MENRTVICNRCHGFTLIEVLAALAVIAIAMTALLASSTHIANNQQHLEELSFAGWAADTVMTETRLREPFPAIGRSTGQTRIGHYLFRWERVVQATPEIAIRRIDLYLYRSHGDLKSAPIYNLAGFAGLP